MVHRIHALSLRLGCSPILRSTVSKALPRPKFFANLAEREKQG